MHSAPVQTRTHTHAHNSMATLRHNKSEIRKKANGLLSIVEFEAQLIAEGAHSGFWHE